MRFVYFTHSLVSDWNHGNAHFLRGIVSELQFAGHQVRVYEPAEGWSLQNLRKDEGEQPLVDFARAYPMLRSIPYSVDRIDLDAALDGADVVIVHEWSDPSLVAAIGKHRARRGNYHLLFHDTHHRAATDAEAMQRYDLEHYDGVLAFGKVIRDLYLERGWAERSWTWHEAADTRIFAPRESAEIAHRGDVVWVGNWGDEERSEELRIFLFEPVRRMRLEAHVYGVRYPQSALRELAESGIAYEGWLPNFSVPRVFAQFGCTIHIPRRPYREELSGVPTIRVFEALACGIPLICLRWNDSEHLFTPGEDYLVVDSPEEMAEAMHAVLTNCSLRERLVQCGLETILARHTCAHRVEELFQILQELDGSTSLEAPPFIVAES